MSGRATRVRIKLPAILLERARQEADQHGLTVGEFVSQTAHSALAERLCVHRARAPSAQETEPAD